MNTTVREEIYRAVRQYIEGKANTYGLSTRYGEADQITEELLDLIIAIIPGEHLVSLNRILSAGMVTGEKFSSPLDYPAGYEPTSPLGRRMMPPLLDEDDEDVEPEPSMGFEEFVTTALADMRDALQTIAASVAR